ncbi:MAG: hypothetical protein AB7G75_28490, partial [Candidatus Binatia bacterium]
DFPNRHRSVLDRRHHTTAEFFRICSHGPFPTTGRMSLKIAISGDTLRSRRCQEDLCFRGWELKNSASLGRAL